MIRMWSTEMLRNAQVAEQIDRDVQLMRKQKQLRYVEENQQLVGGIDDHSYEPAYPSMT